MSELLLDTDVFSCAFKRDSRAEAYAPLLRGATLCLSFMSVAEIKRWAIQRRWGSPRIAALNEALRHYIVVPFDAAITDTWAEIAAQRSKLGKPIGCGDVGSPQQP